MYDFLPHGGPLPPGYGDVYGATPPRAFVAAGPGRQTVQQAKAAQPLLQKAIQSARAPLAIPDFDTWNVGAGMIEQVPAKTEESPWYMNKILWAAGGIGLLVGGYFLLRNRGGGNPLAAAMGR
jgi:hypothetical protein